MKAKIKWKTEPYVSPRAIITIDRFYKLKLFINYFIASILGGIAFLILYICLTSNNDVDKMNECLKTHDLNYCNKAVK